MLTVIVAFGREDHEYLRFRSRSTSGRSARAIDGSANALHLAVSTITAIGTPGHRGRRSSRPARQTHVGAAHDLYCVPDGRLSALEAISFTIGSIQDKLVSLRMAFAILDTEPEIKDDPTRSR